jgi:hypothetical protein
MDWNLGLDAKIPQDYTKYSNPDHLGKVIPMKTGTWIVPITSTAYGSSIHNYLPHPIWEKPPGSGSVSPLIFEPARRNSMVTNKMHNSIVAIFSFIQKGILAYLIKQFLSIRPNKERHMRILPWIALMAIATNTSARTCQDDINDYLAAGHEILKPSVENLMSPLQALACIREDETEPA